MEKPQRNWDTKRVQKAQRLAKISQLMTGKYVETDQIITVLEALIAPGDKVVLEGDNQKQASFLSQSLEQVNPEKVNNLHMIMSSISRPEHLNIFERQIASKIDFSYAGAQSVRVAQMIEDGKMKLGDIHTYLELYGRLFIDLIPNVVLVAADKADKAGNLYTGFNTEETPTIVEAAAFKDGIVIVQVNEVVDELPRIDIPAGWVDVVVPADKPYELEALFTHDPQNITELQILMAMMAIKGIYAEHGVQSLNHGIGFNTAAIELLLPTYGESLGLKGKIAKNWALNPHPTIIPAIESGWVESIHSFGGAPNMGHNPGGRRHSTPAWQSLRDEEKPLGKGQKLVVQMVETYGSNKKPVFVETLDALAVQEQASLANAPVMIYSEDTTHIVTEEGIAYLYKATSKEQR